jgi:hypothetical protein
MIAVPLACTTRAIRSSSNPGASAAVSVPTLKSDIVSMKPVESHWPVLASIRRSLMMRGSATPMMVSLRNTTNVATSIRLTTSPLRLEFSGAFAATPAIDVSAPAGTSDAVTAEDKVSVTRIPSRGRRDNCGRLGPHESKRRGHCLAHSRTSALSPLSPRVNKLSCSSCHGLWRSLVAHLTGGQGVASSNLVSPTKWKTVTQRWPFSISRRYVDGAPAAPAPAHRSNASRMSAPQQPRCDGRAGGARPDAPVQRSAVRALALRPTQPAHDENDADDHEDQPDIEPRAVTGHEASRDQVQALPGEYPTDEKSYHSDDDLGGAPDSSIHSGQPTLDCIITPMPMSRPSTSAEASQTLLDAVPATQAKGCARAFQRDKFLVAPGGEVVGRFSPKTLPDDPAFVDAIEALLLR